MGGSPWSSSAMCRWVTVHAMNSLPHVQHVREDSGGPSCPRNVLMICSTTSLKYQIPDSTYNATNINKIVCLQLLVEVIETRYSCCLELICYSAHVLPRMHHLDNLEVELVEEFAPVSPSPVSAFRPPIFFVTVKI